MALRIHVDIVSAESSIYSGQAERVVIPAEQGEICVLARHAPLLTKLKPGLVRMLTNSKLTYEFFVSSGFVEIQPHTVTILADSVKNSMRRRQKRHVIWMQAVRKESMPLIVN
jgi:F-type H+-transporting ATPase subunit epsilon